MAASQGCLGMLGGILGGMLSGMLSSLGSMCSRVPVCLGWPSSLGRVGGPRVLCSIVCHTLPRPGGPRRVAEIWRSLAPVGAELWCVPFPELDTGYRPMYSGDIPLDPIDMHMDMDGDYPMDAYSDGVRAPFTDHMLA